MQDRNRKSVADFRAMKARGQKISMLYVTTPEEAQAAFEAHIDVLSIEGRFLTREMRDAAGNSFIQAGLPYGPAGDLVTANDYLAAAFHYMDLGGDCFYCAASLEIQKTLCDNAVPVVAHVGLIPSQCTWTGGFVAVGKSADSARQVWDHVKRLEAIGCFGAELEVVPDRVAEYISKNTSVIMFGMGAGPGADAQYLFAEDVLGQSSGHKPRHAKSYRNFNAELQRLQSERIAAFSEFVDDVGSGAYPAAAHTVGIDDAEFNAFVTELQEVHVG